MYAHQPIDSPIFDQLKCDTIPCSFEIDGRREDRNIKVLPPYQFSTATRVAAVALIVTTLAVCILALQGKLVGFPGHFLHWVHHINIAHAVVGTSIVVVLTGGALIVIYHVKNNVRNPFTGKTYGETEEWMPGVLLYYNSSSKQIRCHSLFYVDRSSLDENGHGKALNYNPSLSPENEIISFNISLFTPLYTIGEMVYNVIRAVVIPFYILGSLFIDRWTGEEQYEWCDIPKEFGLSIWKVVRAPFYATASIFALVYSLINPTEGSKLGSWIARDKNFGKPLRQGVWLCFPQEDFEWDGPAYIAKCRQPIGRTVIDGHGNIELHSTGRMINKPGGNVYKAKIIQRRLVAIWDEGDFDFTDDASVS